MKLTDNEVKNTLVPSKGTKQLNDGGGLYLEIRASGKKYWKRKYTSPTTKKQTILHIGTYPDMGLKAARLANQKAQLLISDGIDPNEQKQAEKQGFNEKIQNTFEHIARTWHSDRAKQGDKWTPAHAHRVLRSLEIHIFPDLGKRPIADIMPLDVLTLLKRIEHAGKRDTAHKVYDVVNQVFSYAVRLRLCVFNPVAELRTELAQIKQKAFPHITDPKEIGELLRQIDGYNGMPTVRVALQIAPYVFVRPNELCSMKWGELDFQAALWHKDETEMKNGIAHIIPLSRQVIALIESMRPFTGHYEYVFHNRNTGKPITTESLSKAMQRMGYKDIATPHGFRHTASTRLNEMDYKGEWVEYQLAHKEKNSSRASYNYAQYIEQRAKMLQEWADYLDHLKQAAWKAIFANA